MWIRLGLAILGGFLLLWVVLILLARRLPPGVLREAVLFIPHAAVTARRLLKDPRVPRRVKIALALAALWVISPVDLVPEFLPVVGPLDDLVVVALALRYAARRCPPEAITEAWPGSPDLLRRMLGPPR